MPSKVGIIRRVKQKIGCWKDMLWFNNCGGVADRLEALKMVLTKASAAKQ